MSGVEKKINNKRHSVFESIVSRLDRIRLSLSPLQTNPQLSVQVEHIPQLPLSKGGLHTTVLPSAPSPGNAVFTRSGKTLYRARTIIPFLSPPSVTLHDH